MARFVSFPSGVVALVLCAGSLAGCKETWPEVSKEALKRAYRDPKYKDLEFFGLPVTGRGVGTIYLEFDPKASPRLWIDSDTWWATADQSVREKWWEEAVSPVDAPNVAQSSNVTRQIAAKLALDTLEPSVAGVANFDWSKGTKVSLACDQLVIRELRWAKFNELLKAEGVLVEAVGEALKDPRFALVDMDFVCHGFGLDIEIDSALNAGLTAALEEAVGTVAGGSLNGSFSRKAKGSYALRAEAPVTLATRVLRKDQKTAGPLAGGQGDLGPEDFEVVTPSSDLFSFLNSEVFADR